MNVLAVVGARPNFIKTAPVLAALRRAPRCETQVLVHTGQHYDAAMSRVFFEELGIPDPAYNLKVGSGSHAVQTARVMTRLEPVLLGERPDAVLVAGDVNSTLAAAITATKLDIPVAHIEAGLRSFDRTMPEEINRVLTDAISSFLFIHSPEAVDHLLREGADARSIHDVGNTMIDTLVSMRARIDAAAERVTDYDERRFYVVTLHRPALTDGPLLADAVTSLRTLAEHLPVVFPIHPRTLARCRAEGLSLDGIRLREPMGYIDFVGLVSRSAGVVTDSGGIQEETTYLGVPCFTLRDNTERPITISAGTNVLLGLQPKRILDVPSLLTELNHRPARIPAGWDGRAGERAAAVLVDALA